MHPVMFPNCVVCSQEADAAALQDFRKELSEMRGRDILSLWCHGLLDV